MEQNTKALMSCAVICVFVIVMQIVGLLNQTLLISYRTACQLQGATQCQYQHLAD